MYLIIFYICFFMKNGRWKYRRFFALQGIVILIFPLVFQMAHIIMVHHTYDVCQVKGIFHLHQYHKDCSIEKFKYYSFTDNTKSYVNGVIISQFVSIISSYEYNFINPFLQGVLLRSPPYFILQ